LQAQHFFLVFLFRYIISFFLFKNNIFIKLGGIAISNNTAVAAAAAAMLLFLVVNKQQGNVRENISYKNKNKSFVVLADYFTVAQSGN
jgi:hypothetical protein